jgi:hypothetical protein
LATGLKEPIGLSFDSKGNLFVSDLGSNSIYKITPKGEKSTFASGISSVGMAVDRSGNLFVSHDDSVFKFTPEGVKTTFVSGLGNPIDLAFDGTGNLFVVDCAVWHAGIGRWILRFSPDGTKSGFASGFDDPRGLAFDGVGNLFITEVTAADASSHAILEFSTDGTKKIFASTLGFDVSSGLACDRITLIETGEAFPNTTPDQVLVIGTLANGAAFTIQIEGGKRNNSGLQIDITGMEGDLKVSNPLSFTNTEDNKVEGVKGDGEPLGLLPIPASYQGLPASTLDASVLDLAYLYAAYANDRKNGTRVAPTFADALKMHRLIDLISEASSTGTRQTVNFW